MNSMNGKRVIITGPTSGVGKEIAMGLTALGADLILACRDLEKGERVAAEIAHQSGSSNVEVMPIDTSSQESIRTFAANSAENMTIWMC
jgi:short-subunit dehydrogenase